MDHHAFFLPAVKLYNLFLREGDNTVLFCMDCKIPSDVGISPRTELRPFLTNDDTSSTNGLPSKELYATALAITVPAVTGGATGFLMCHALNSREVY